MTRQGHSHTWRYVGTEDDGARLVIEERCRTCGKGRRKPYRYGWGPAAVPQGRPAAETETGVNLPLFVLGLAASVAFVIWMALELIRVRASSAPLPLD